MLKRAITAVTLAGLCLLAACARTQDPSVTYFIVRVDSIAVPDSIPQADTLKIKLYGTIGNSGAYSFDRFEAERTAHNLSLTVWGKHTEMELEPMVIVELRGKEYPVSTLYPGLFKINVRQPDSTFLRDSVAVH